MKWWSNLFACKEDCDEKKILVTSKTIEKGSLVLKILHRVYAVAICKIMFLIKTLIYTINVSISI